MGKGGISMRRELQTEQMRRRILDSALEVFGAEGYDGASMNAICTRAGISKGIIYHYFAGKEDLYLSCCRESTQKMADYLREHPVSGGTLRQQVGEFLALRHRFFEEYPRYEAVFYEVLFGHPLYLRPQLGEIRSRLEQVNLDFFRQTARRQPGTVPEDLDACFQILLQGIWLAAEQISEPDAEKIRLHEQQVIRLMEIFFRGLECPDATEKQEVIL